MIRPHKHTDPCFSVINIGGMIIQALKTRKTFNFDDLLSHLIKQTSEEIKDMYLPSLSFLFLLGKLVYHQESDSFQLVD